MGKRSEALADNLNRTVALLRRIVRGWDDGIPIVEEAKLRNEAEALCDEIQFDWPALDRSTRPRPAADDEAMAAPDVPLIDPDVGRAVYEHRRQQERFGFLPWEKQTDGVREKWSEAAARGVGVFVRKMGESLSAVALDVDFEGSAKMNAQLRQDRDRLMRALRLLVDPRPALSADELHTAMKHARELIAEIDLRSAQ